MLQCCNVVVWRFSIGVSPSVDHAQSALRYPAAVRAELLQFAVGRNWAILGG